MATKKKTRNPIIRVHLDQDEILVDNFAGGGGASSGVELALGRSPDIAINHDAEAIAMHKANHPECKHYCESVWEVDPIEACGGRRVALAWFSPDCKHFSKAKGTTPREQKIRGLAWSATRWAQLVKPRVICLENVEEFATWGPLHTQHVAGCKPTKKKSAKTKAMTVVCSKASCNYGLPVKEKKGQTFRAFIRKLERLGYKVEWRLLRACDYGAPTSRRRFFMVARCDSQAIIWPEPSHGPGRPAPYRTAAECIDWTVNAPSIFDRKKKHADKTLARIARGVRKFVLTAAKPYVVTMRGTEASQIDSASTSIDEPLRTISAGGTHHAVVTPYIIPTAHGGGEGRGQSIETPLTTVCGNRGDQALVVPYMVHRSNGERPVKVDADGTVHAAQAPRIYDIKEPLGTIMAQGQKHALVSAMLLKHNGGNNDACGASGQSLDKPCDSITSRDSKSLATVTLGQLGDEEMMQRAREVFAFLVRYNGKGEPESLEKPLGTLTTKDRYGLVTVTVDGQEYIVVDIGMRMLTPRELFRAQGFSDSYDIEATSVLGAPLTKTAQVKMCGNSVPPPMGAAIVRAQFSAKLNVDDPQLDLTLDDQDGTVSTFSITRAA